MNYKIMLLLIFFSANVFADPPHVLAQLPSQQLRIGDVVEIPLNIFSEEMEIVSFAVELKFDPSLVRLMDVFAGLTPMFNDKPMYRLIDSHTISITGSARSFGAQQKIINVANLKFELISETSKPRFELLQAGPTVRKREFAEVDAVYSVEGEMDLYNFIFDAGFE